MDTATRTHVSIDEAAAQLGVKPYDVVRLIRQQQLESVELVSVSSLQAYRQEERR